VAAHAHANRNAGALSKLAMANWHMAKHRIPNYHANKLMIYGKSKRVLIQTNKQMDSDTNKQTNESRYKQTIE